MVSDRLKDLIFKSLYRDLSHVELIHYDDCVWFIDRDNKYWYFRYHKSNGQLLWRHSFFINFFIFFTMKSSDFTSVISSWVEEVLNHKVDTTIGYRRISERKVEEVLNHKVDTTRWAYHLFCETVEEVLNHKVTKTTSSCTRSIYGIEDVLKYKVDRSFEWMGHPPVSVNVVLNSVDK